MRRLVRLLIPHANAPARDARAQGNAAKKVPNAALCHSAFGHFGFVCRIAKKPHFCEGFPRLKIMPRPAMTTMMRSFAAGGSHGYTLLDDMGHQPIAQ